MSHTKFGSGFVYTGGLTCRSNCLSSSSSSMGWKNSVFSVCLACWLLGLHRSCSNSRFKSSKLRLDANVNVECLSFQFDSTMRFKWNSNHHRHLKIIQKLKLHLNVSFVSRASESLSSATVGPVLVRNLISFWNKIKQKKCIFLIFYFNSTFNCFR